MGNNVAKFIPRRVAQLLDVTVDSPADGDVLAWNEADSRWENIAGGGGGGGATTLLELTDVAGTDGAGKAPVSNGSDVFTLTDVATQAELNSAVAALSSVYQPLDSDLTAIAALASTSYGRAFLGLADAAAGRTALALGTAAVAATGDFDASGAAAAAQAASQPLDSDLTAIAALTTTSFGRAFLALADAAAGRTALGLGTLATQSGTFSGTSSGVNTGDQTTVSGNAGTATALATSRNIDGQGFDGTANITVIAPGTHAATGKTTPVDADELALVDSAASNVLKKLTWANLKATLKAYTDTLYDATGAAASAQAASQPLDADLTALGGLTSAANKGIQFTGSGAAATYDLTAAGKALLDDADAAAQRTTLGLGTVATLTSDTDGTLAANSDSNVATQKAVKTYVAAHGGELIPWTWVTKSTDESVASSTTLQADDELLFTAVSGGIYEIQILIIYASPAGAGTPDLKYMPYEDATVRGGWSSFGAGGVSVSEGFGGNDSMTSSGGTPGSAGTAATNRPMLLFASHAGGGGTFALYWAQNTSGSNATIVRAGSVLRYRRIL